MKIVQNIAHNPFCVYLVTYSVLIPLLRIVNNTSVVNGLLSLLADVIILLIVVNISSPTSISRFFPLDIFIALYILYSISSALTIIATNNSHPQLYFLGLHMTVIPMILYFAAKKSKQHNDYYLKSIWFVGLIHTTIGFFIYKPFLEFVHPSISVRLMELSTIISNKIEDNWGLAIRMRSVLDSLSFGSIASVTVILSFYFLRKNQTLLKYTTLIASIIAVLFSGQRSAWAGTTLMVLILVLFQGKAKVIKDLFVVSSIVAILLISIITILPDNILNFIYTRFEDIVFARNIDASAVSTRLDQWKLGIRYFVEYPFGYGTGTLGHKSVQYVTCGVYDGNYFKIMAETGIVGIVCFIFIIIIDVALFVKMLLAKKADSDTTVLFCILLLYFLQAIGSNVWDLYYINVVFWIIQGLFAKTFISKFNYATSAWLISRQRSVYN